MDFLHIYEELNEVWGKLESLKGDQYTMADIPLNRRDEISKKVYETQELILEIRNEVAINIENEWL